MQLLNITTNMRVYVLKQDVKFFYIPLQFGIVLALCKIRPIHL